MNRAAQRLKTVFFGVLVVTLGIECLVISKGAAVMGTYPETSHGMKWNREKQDRLEAKIVAAETRIDAWLSWAVPLMIFVSAAGLLIVGAIVGTAHPSIMTYAWWAAVFVAVRTCVDLLGWITIADGLPSWSLLSGWSMFSFFTIVLAAIVARKWLTGSLPYFNHPPPSILLDSRGQPISNAASAATITWISVVGAITSITAALNGIVKLLMQFVDPH